MLHILVANNKIADELNYSRGERHPTLLVYTVHGNNWDVYKYMNAFTDGVNAGHILFEI